MNMESGRKNRATLLLIAGIPVVVILAATLLWLVVDSGRVDVVGLLGTANRGTLVQPPRPLAKLELRDVAGEAWRVEPGPEGLWYLVVPGAASCDATCDERLYFTRQLRAAMGKYQPRLQRLYLVRGAARGDALSEAQRGEHPGLKVLYTPATQFDGLFADAARDGDAPAYYVVDPRGWMMMYYTADHHYKDVMADLKFLLKNSGG
jgi:hypothetical protein